MLASRTLSDHYLGTANYVNVDAAVPPDWYLDMNKKSGFSWTDGSYGNKRLWAPAFVFLTNRGEYMCTMRGMFNNYTHALNLINGIKARNRVYAPSPTQRDCPAEPI